MKVVIVGAGVVGVTTAYSLAKRGYQVVLVDQYNQAGCGTSYGNGGQLSYHYQTPIANPKVLAQLPKILLGLDPAFRVYPSFDTTFYRWIARFLFCCLPHKSKHSTKVMHELGNLAKQQLTNIIAETGIAFDYRYRSGKLYLYNKPLQLKNSQLGSVWSKKKILEGLPALNKNTSIVSGIFDQHDDSADSYKFCGELTRFLQRHYDVAFLSGQKVMSIQHKNNKIIGIETNNEIIKADNYIVAAGASSVELVRPLGIFLPIYPMKGYSVTVPATELCPDISVTDTEKKTVYCKLGNRLRIAGFAEFSGFDTEIKAQRIEYLLNNARHFLPQAGNYDHILDQWCGLRPMTPDSVPIVSGCLYQNLFFNTGHGMLGWTHAAATADVMASIISNTAVKLVDKNSLSLNRF